MRVEWSARGDEILVHRGTQTTIWTGVGTKPYARWATTRPYFDARWTSDGRVVLIDDKTLLTYETTSPTPVEIALAPRYRNEPPMTAASFSRGGTLVAIQRGSIDVYDGRGESIWKRTSGSHVDGTITGFTLSDDGRRLAIGYTTQPLRGRGWAVIDVEDESVLDRAYVPMPTLRSESPVFAFDGAGRRMIRAWPEGNQDGCAIRIDRGEVYPRTRPGGARAVSLDERGVIAVYAYPAIWAGMKGRLWIDYLEPAAAGPTEIAVLTTLSIDPELKSIGAIAVSPDGRSIACVDATGHEIEIVPVP